MLKATELHEGTKSKLCGSDKSSGHKVLPLDNSKPTLSDLGLTKNESSTYQKIAAIPSDVFEEGGGRYERRGSFYRFN